MRKLWIPLVLMMMVAVALAGPQAGTVLAGQEKVDICHVNGNGTYNVISVAEPALDAHLEHGDLVVGEDVDENCEPLSPAQAGCFPVVPYQEGTAYALLDGSPVQDMDELLVYQDATCQIVYDVSWTGGTGAFVWAFDEAEAQNICDGLGGTLYSTPLLTSNLFACLNY